MIRNGICSVSDNCGEVIIRGQSNLIGGVDDGASPKNINNLFKQLHEQETIQTILDNSVNGQGFKVFIGSESNIFDSQNCSMIVSPYRSSGSNLVGVVGVFGNYRMKYSKVITLVNYTAELLKKIM